MLKRFTKVGHVAAIVGLCLPLQGFAAPETVRWGVVGGWDISFYPDAKGCQAFALFEHDTAFFIGFDDTDGRRSLNVTLIDQSWTNIEDGEEYPVQVQFGPNPTWTLAMDGRVMNGYPALSIHINSDSDEAEQFVREFREETEMAWTVDDIALARLTLRGSLKAFDEVLACQNADHSLKPVPAATAPEEIVPEEAVSEDTAPKDTAPVSD
ncbi:hypothetical protein [Falsiphaeobacter marinintestinus]|uniref:hypothetical protein n=1 Tax=Falsiphaeobacter marinintestinus TaxID=1492905 RepID=UPI0011B5E10B|nr:hypothetical protein [Phaeobacter marinintestinus]